MNSIFHRRSIRKFTDQPVEKEKIELMLRAAMAAPSACNQQPWEYYVITGEENVQRLCACGYPAETKEPADRYEEKRVHWVGTSSPFHR